MDVLKFAVELDRKGRDFYQLQAQRAGSESARRIFSRLAVEEEGRLAEYRRLLAAGGERKVESGVLDGVHDPFDEPAEESEVDSELMAYKLALAVEGQVCRMLEDAAAREKEVPAREALQRLAVRECGGVREMENLYDFVNAPNEFLAWQEFSNLDEFHNFGRYEDNRGCRHTG